MNFLPLLFQHEEVQFLEHELENQKHKYQELASFTKSLLSAVRNNDLQRQQVHSQSCLHTDKSHLNVKLEVKHQHL